MLKEKFEPVDLTEMADDEIRYLGECFYKAEKELADMYRPYFGHQNYFIQLDEILSFVRKQLELERRIE